MHMTTPMAKPASKRKPGSNKGAKEARIDRFVEAFLANGGNARQSAIDAGYSPKSADVAAWRLQKDARVLQQIEKRRAEVLDKFKLTTERVYREIARISFSDPRAFYHPDGRLKAIHELDDDCAAVIASVEVDEIKAGDTVIGVTKKIKAWDKNSALDKAAKILGAYEKNNVQPLAAMVTAVDRMASIEAVRAKFAQVLAK